MLGIYLVAAQLMTSRVVPRSKELVSYKPMALWATIFSRGFIYLLFMCQANSYKVK
jgi:hypothetical protein